MHYRWLMCEGATRRLLGRCRACHQMGLITNLSRPHFTANISNYTPADRVAVRIRKKPSQRTLGRGVEERSVQQEKIPGRKMLMILFILNVCMIFFLTSLNNTLYYKDIYYKVYYRTKFIYFIVNSCNFLNFG